MANNICQYFCRKSFYSSTERIRGKIKQTLREGFNNDDILRKVCQNRLGIDWYESEPQSTFNITPKMVMYQGFRSARYVNMTSFFKSSVSKLIYLKYSQENDLVYDFSMGFGARALGAISSNRKYLGIDPLTCDEIKEMLEFFNIPQDRYKLIKGCSEDYCEGLVDFAFSSPPYYDQEYYSSEVTQAYNKTEDYFYDVYWAKTLQNIKKMLKPDKYFALNLSIKFERMFNMACEVFDKPVEIFRLRLIKSHLNKTGYYKEGISIFVYDDKKLIGWGVLSKPDEFGNSSCVIGKAWCNACK